MNQVLSAIGKTIKRHRSFAIAAATVGLCVLPGHAMAMSMSIPFISEIGCAVVQYMRSTLSIIVFVIVVIAALIMGFMGKVGWDRILMACVLFGLITGIGSWLGSSSYVANFSSCLQ